MTDGDIYDTMFGNGKALVTAENLIGKPAVLTTFPLKIDGVEDFLEDVQTLSETITPETAQKIVEKLNPTECEKYTTLPAEIAALKKTFPEVQKQGKEALDELKRQINTKTSELRQLGTNLSPQVKVDKIIALSALSENKKVDLNEFIDLIKDDAPENNAAWNKAVNEKIFEQFDMEYDENLSQRLNLVKSKYLDKVLSADEDFGDNFKTLLECLQENPNKPIKDIFNDLPQNVETKCQFEARGIDYDKWVNVDKNSYTPVTVELNAQEARQAAISNVEADFNDPSFAKLPQEQKDKLINVLKNEGITLKNMTETQYDADGYTTGTKDVLRLYEGEKPIEFNRLVKVLSEIKKEINSDDFWTKKHPDTEMDNAVGTFYNHIIKLRDVDVKNAQDIKGDSEVTLEIHKTDMNDILHALFLGNNASCCTAVGTGCNQFSAPTYIMNKTISAIEVMDGKNFVGNSMCYIAEIDGKPSLVLDNIEMSAKYQNNDQIRDAFMNYAKKITEEIGQPDMPIYAGPYRHKLNMNVYPQAEHDVKIVGSTGEQEIYIDYVTGRYQVDGERTDKVNLFKIN